MTLSQDRINNIIRCINKNKYTNDEIMDLYDIGKNTFYKIKNNINKKNIYNSKRNTKRNTKITPFIKKYIIGYVLRKKFFNYKKIVQLIYKKYKTIISKSSIYNILKNNKIKKKRSTRKYY